jgi:hypothetical protein
LEIKGEITIMSKNKEHSSNRFNIVLNIICGTVFTLVIMYLGVLSRDNIPLMIVVLGILLLLGIYTGRRFLKIIEEIELTEEVEV